MKIDFGIIFVSYSSGELGSHVGPNRPAICCVEIVYDLCLREGVGDESIAPFQYEAVCWLVDFLTVYYHAKNCQISSSFSVR